MKKIGQLMILLTILFSTFFGCKQDNNKTALENKMRTFFKTWTTHDIDKMTSYFTDDCVYEEVWSGRQFKGKEGVRFYAKETFNYIPDFTAEITSFHTIDNWVFIEFLMSGNYPIQVSGSGKPGWTLKGSYFVELRNDSVYKVRDYWNMPGDSLKFKWH